MSKVNYVEILHNVASELNTSIADLASSLGEKKGTLYQVTSGTNAISKRLANKIIEKHPQFNIDYLLTGKEPIKWTPPKAVLSNENITEEIYKEVHFIRLKINYMQNDINKILKILEEK